VFVAAFGVLWTFLEPIGGFGAIDNAISRDAMNYLALCLLSLVIAIVVALIRTSAGAGEGSRLGIVADSRMETDFLKLLASAKTKIAIVGISLPTFTTEKGLRAIAKALKNGARVDLLFVNPVSPAIQQRPKDLYTPYQQPLVAAATSLGSCLRFKEKLGAEEAGRFRVRLVNVLPTCAAVIIDDVCCWHPYLVDYTGVNSPYIQESTTTGFGRHITSHVDGLLQTYSFEPEEADIDALKGGLAADALVSKKLTSAEMDSVRNGLAP
jgi:hypothetical protein